MNGDYIEFDLTAKGFTMTEQKGNTGEKREQKTEKKEKKDAIVLSEEMIRWMTEGTSRNMVPRSDCG